jgi:hypothetical protein
VTFVRLLREADLSHLKLYGLRHLNISLQLEAGVPETVIAMRVGTSQSQTVWRPKDSIAGGCLVAAT